MKAALWFSSLALTLFTVGAQAYPSALRQELRDLTKANLEYLLKGAQVKGALSVLLERNLQVKELTAKEKKLLSPHCSGETIVSLESTILNFPVFYKRYGRSPADGLDLLLMYDTSALKELGPNGLEDKLHAVALGLNPVTGRLYPDFAKNDGPLTLSVVRVEGAAGVKSIPESNDGKTIKVVKHRIWRFAVRGEKSQIISKGQFYSAE